MRETPVGRVMDFDLYLICTQIVPFGILTLISTGPGRCVREGTATPAHWFPATRYLCRGSPMGAEWPGAQMPGSGKQASCARLPQERAGRPPGVLDMFLQQKSQRDLSASPPRTCNPRRSTPTTRHLGSGPSSKKESSTCSRGSGSPSRQPQLLDRTRS